MTVEAPPGRMEQARAGMRRAAFKRQVEAVAAGSTTSLPIDLDDGAGDVAAVVAEVARPLQPQSPSLARLVAAFHRSGAADAIVAGLAEEDPVHVQKSCPLTGPRLLGAGGPWLSPARRSNRLR